MLFFKLLASPMRNNFPKQPFSVPLYTLSKLYDVPVGFFFGPPPPIRGSILLYLRSPKGGCRYPMICLEDVFTCAKPSVGVAVKVLAKARGLGFDSRFRRYDFRDWLSPASKVLKYR